MKLNVCMFVVSNVDELVIFDQTNLLNLVLEQLVAYACNIKTVDCIF